MFAMACIDRQNEIDKLKREKVLAVARKESIKEKKKKFRAMLNDGSLETIVKAIRDRGNISEYGITAQAGILKYSYKFACW